MEKSGSNKSVKAESSEFAYPSQPGIYKLSFLTLGGKEEPVFTPVADSMDSFLEDAKFGRMVRLDRLFWCPECNDGPWDDAQAVQDHADRSHNCHLETAEVRRKDGTSYVVVKTRKCHPRRTIEEIAGDWRMDVRTIRALKGRPTTRQNSPTQQEIELWGALKK